MAQDNVVVVRTRVRRKWVLRLAAAGAWLCRPLGARRPVIWLLNVLVGRVAVEYKVGTRRWQPVGRIVVKRERL
jgi:hypothetical protein